jgi:hypothetical protein
MAACVVALGLGLAGPAAAQFPTTIGTPAGGAGYRPGFMPYNPAPLYGPGYTAPLSPFLNLLRGGDTASNYFLGVIPEQQRRANARAFGTAINQLSQQQQLQAQQGGPDADLFRPLPTTGHPIAFQNYGGYFSQPGGRRVGPSQPAQPLRRP